MNTFTTTSTFTRTNAKYLASKVAADLKQMQIFYDSPSDEKIVKYIEEVVILMLGGYLESVIYGFKKDGEWMTGALRYNASWNDIVTDEPSGRVFSQANVTGANWASYLIKSKKFSELTRGEQEKIEAILPINRTTGSEPESEGIWSVEKTYSSGGGTFTKLTLKLK